MSKFVLGQGLGHELEMAIGRTGGGTSDVQWLRTDRNFENVIRLARGEAELTLKARPVAPATVIDPIVRVDRSVRPVYPDWVDAEAINRPDFIELEKSGPAEFDVTKLRRWLHPKQKRGLVVGDVIYECLKQKQMLPSCLGLADLLGIQAKGLKFFRQHFMGQAPSGWRSTVPNRFGALDVPYLVEGDGEVVQSWYWLVYDWVAYNPALCFAR